jgi:hypothetical protein
MSSGWFRSCSGNGLFVEAMEHKADTLMMCHWGGETISAGEQSGKPGIFASRARNVRGAELGERGQ